jgi:hypothetical protein
VTSVKDASGFTFSSMIPRPVRTKRSIGTTWVTHRSSLKLSLALLVTLVGASASCATRTESGVWWEEADLIAAVEILNVDYSATASDGPMVAEALLLKLAKGSGSRTIRFGASAWLGPNYEKGDRRILFLRRTAPTDAYFRNANWISLETGKLNLFVKEEAAQSLRYDSLIAFLTKLSEAARNKGVTADITVSRSTAATLELRIKIVNTSNEPLYLDPTRLTVAIDAGSVRRYVAVQWDNVASGWQQLEPGASLLGAGKLERRELNDVASANVILENHSVCYPHPSWNGAFSVPVVLPQWK